MKFYHVNKDYEYWPGVKWDSDEAPKPAPQAMKPTAIKNPTYKTTKVREADGSVTFYTTQVRREPVMLGGYMV